MKEVDRSFNSAITSVVNKARQLFDFNHSQIDDTDKTGKLPLESSEEYDRLLELARTDQQNMIDDIMYYLGFRF